MVNKWVLGNPVTDFDVAGFARIRAAEVTRPEVWRHQLRLRLLSISFGENPAPGWGNG